MKDINAYTTLGKTVKQFSLETECPRCGCKGTIYEYGGCFEE